MRPILGHILTFPDPPLPKTNNNHQYNTSQVPLLYLPNHLIPNWKNYLVKKNVKLVFTKKSLHISILVQTAVQEYIQYPENPTGHCLLATSFNRTKVYIFPDVCSILISCHWIEAAQHPPTPPVPSLQKIQFSLPHSQTRCLFTSILKKYNTT